MQCMLSAEEFKGNSGSRGAKHLVMKCTVIPKEVKMELEKIANNITYTPK